MANVIKSISAIVCGISGFLWGNLDGLLSALIAFMAIDYLTGIAVGYVQKSLSSRVGYIGIFKKFLILCVVAVGHILDTRVIGSDGSLCRSAVIGFYLANEGLSILENSGKLGLPLPKFLKSALEQLREKSDNKESGKDET